MNQKLTGGRPRKSRKSGDLRLAYSNRLDAAVYYFLKSLKNQAEFIDKCVMRTAEFQRWSKQQGDCPGAKETTGSES